VKAAWLNLMMIAIALEEQVIYLSYAPYQISCDLTGATIQFGIDSEDNQGVNDNVDLYSYSEKTPQLGVSPDSIRACSSDKSGNLPKASICGLPLK
jgi:hypothetical protein